MKERKDMNGNERKREETKGTEKKWKETKVRGLNQGHSHALRSTHRTVLPNDTSKRNQSTAQPRGCTLENFTHLTSNVSGQIYLLLPDPSVRNKPGRSLSIIHFRWRRKVYRTSQEGTDARVEYASIKARRWTADRAGGDEEVCKVRTNEFG